MLPRSWFENWRNPKEFFCTAWEQIKPYTGNAPLQYLRDAYVVGLFARIFSYDSRCEVKLSHGKDEFPDARLSFFAPPNEFPNTQIIRKEQRYLADIEIVTADKCLRETWKELRELTEIYRRHEYPPSTDSPKERRKALLEAIPRVVKKKAEKHYTPPPNLLVVRTQRMVPSTSQRLRGFRRYREGTKCQILTTSTFDDSTPAYGTMSACYYRRNGTTDRTIQE